MPSNADFSDENSDVDDGFTSNTGYKTVALDM